MSCSDTKNNNISLSRLSFNSLFNLDSVALFVRETPASFKDSSQKVFLNAVQLFVNQKNPVEAISIFIKALLIYPTPGAYYELGNAYLETGKYELALNAYTMAEKLDYKPLNAILFKKACCYAELDDYQSYDYLSYAIENGFVNRDKIFNEPHFHKIRNTIQFTETYNEAMAGNGNADAILWEGYSKEFPEVSFPFLIDTGSYRKIKQADPISYDYEKFVTEMRDYKFSRDVGNEFFYYAKVINSDSITAVVYGSRAYSSDEESIPVYYYLACFDKTGKLIDKKLIAGHKVLDEPVKECSFISSSSFEISEYKNEYQKTKNQYDYEVSKVMKRTFIKTTKFLITVSGKIIII